MYQFSYITQLATKLIQAATTPLFYHTVFLHFTTKKKIEVLYALSRLSVLSLADEKG